MKIKINKQLILENFTLGGSNNPRQSQGYDSPQPQQSQFQGYDSPQQSQFQGYDSPQPQQSQPEVYTPTQQQEESPTTMDKVKNHINDNKDSYMVGGSVVGGAGLGAGAGMLLDRSKIDQKISDAIASTPQKIIPANKDDLKTYFNSPTSKYNLDILNRSTNSDDKQYLMNLISKKKSLGEGQSDLKEKYDEQIKDYVEKFKDEDGYNPNKLGSMIYDKFGENKATNFLNNKFGGNINWDNHPILKKAYDDAVDKHGGILGATTEDKVKDLGEIKTFDTLWDQKMSGYNIPKPEIDF